MIRTNRVNGVSHISVLLIDFAGGLGLIVLQADYLVGAQGGGTNIGRIQEGVIGEDDIIRGHRGAVGEFQVMTQRGAVLGSISSFIIVHLNVRWTFVQIVYAVIGSGLAFNCVEDNRALAVGGQQRDLGHPRDVHVIGSIAKEGAEFL